MDPKASYRALQTRDERFDGRLFVGVVTTRIYCRPVCPANTARFENCRFFPSAAAAQQAGFRPCMRCRPETAPDSGSWHGTSSTVARGLALIEDGALDGDANVGALAARLGMGERQLRRLFKQHLGASPIAVAQTRRVLFAKQLLHDTRLPMVEVALASGFGSVRRFNETFQALFQRPPSALRRKQSVSLPEGTIADSGVTVRLPYRPPCDWAMLLAHLRRRAIAGVETVDDSSYRRVIELDGVHGLVEISHTPESNSLSARIRFPSVAALPAIVSRLRRLFDLGTDVGAIGAHLASDPIIAPCVRARPGLRVPGAWDGFEFAVRAILGQQISVVAAHRLAGELVALCGTPLATPSGELRFAFPTPARVAAADLTALRMPGARRATLRALAEAALSDPRLFDAQGELAETVARLRRVRGIGEWTAQYIALRASREPDAFPASDAGLLRAAAAADPALGTPSALLERAERWRPWRAYAAQHLWTADSLRLARIT